MDENIKRKAGTCQIPKYWLWYPGDLELYHGMKQNFSRVERGYGWPAFWKSEGFHHRVTFRRTYFLKKETQFCVFSPSSGYVLVGEKKYPFQKWIICGPGKVQISIHSGSVERFPAVYIDGEDIYSDPGWMAEDYEHPPVQAGHSKYFLYQTQDPTLWEYQEKLYQPVKESSCRGGVLFEFETELNAVLQVSFNTSYHYVRVCCGESAEEAMDEEHCYYSWEPDPKTGKCPCCALRFVFIPDCKVGEITVRAFHQYIDMPVKADFHCGDSMLEKIWSVAADTFCLCSGIFFIDGAKRDKWIWSGDTYQSLFVNRYLLADAEIEQRTLRALRGNLPVTTHINTIVDYSLLWVLGVMEHIKSYGDVHFLSEIYPKMLSTIEFCSESVDKNGFLIGREKDWIYIDWAEMDKDGPVCAEQMLYAACWDAVAHASRILGKADILYRKKYEQLKDKINCFFWDEEKNAYIDSFTSGKRNVTRHANIFATLFNIASEEQQQKIIENVIDNPAVPQITTPYFKFFEMEMLCKKRKYSCVMEQMRSYWGGMLKMGAVTFWEEYDPTVSREKQYDMYGDRFGKSLCHAWAASPIYFLGRYYIGLEYDSKSSCFQLTPQLRYFKTLDCTLPIGENAKVQIKWDGKFFCVNTTTESGILYLDGKKIQLCKNQPISICCLHSGSLSDV